MPIPAGMSVSFPTANSCPKSPKPSGILIRTIRRASFKPNPAISSSNCFNDEEPARRGSMKKSFIAHLKRGERVDSDFLLQSKERRVAKNGSAYLDLECRDASGSLRGKLWDCDRLKFDFEVDDIVHVTGCVEEFQGTRQISVQTIRKETRDD